MFLTGVVVGPTSSHACFLLAWLVPWRLQGQHSMAVQFWTSCGGYLCLGMAWEQVITSALVGLRAAKGKRAAFYKRGPERLVLYVLSLLARRAVPASI